MKTRKASKASAASDSGQQKVINLTRIKQWYIPADNEAYLTLKKHGVPLLKIHQNFLPTLRLLTQKHNIRGRVVDFNQDILDPFLERLGSLWNKKYGKATITNKVMVFQAKDDKLVEAREAVPKLEERLRQFFDRWGFKFQCEFSEVKSRLKLHVEYWFDNNKSPVILMDEPEVEQPKVMLKLGFTRLVFAFDQHQNQFGKGPGYVHLTIEVSQGGRWAPLRTSRCTYTELSSVLPLVTALMDIPNKDQHNFDNPA